MISIYSLGPLLEYSCRNDQDPLFELLFWIPATCHSKVLPLYFPIKGIRLILPNSCIRWLSVCLLCRPIRKKGCATWDGGKSTWEGRARVLGTVPEVDEVDEESKESEEEVEEEKEEEEDDPKYFDTFPNIEELGYHEWILKNPRPPWVNAEEITDRICVQKYFQERKKSLQTLKTASGFFLAKAICDLGYGVFGYEFIEL
nr:hypothetical protein [Tanacetum cinerariifolium]